VNLSTPQSEVWGLLEVHPEPRLYPPPSKAGLGAVERVNLLLIFLKIPTQKFYFMKRFQALTGTENSGSRFQAVGPRNEKNKIISCIRNHGFLSDFLKLFIVGAALALFFPSAEFSKWGQR